MERAEFERLREIYTKKVCEELQEATQLLCQLNGNLTTWGERREDVQALSQVWARFQNQLIMLSQAMDSGALTL